MKDYITPSQRLSKSHWFYTAAYIATLAFIITICIIEVTK